MDDVNTKHIVVFGANGGIGQAVLNKLADVIQEGRHYKVHIVMRGRPGPGNFIRGLVNEIIDGTSTDPAKQDNLLQAFDHGEHVYMDPKGNIDNLEAVLKNADVVISAGGLPRPSTKPGDPEIPRSAFIYPNAKVIDPIAKAMARFAPAEAVLIVNTNPLDNMVEVADRAFTKEWKNTGRTEELPQVKVIGMSSTLDTIRLKKYIARALNKALEQVGSDIRFDKPRDQVQASVYGQHGPNMAIDYDAITLLPPGADKPVLLTKFIRDNGLEETKFPILEKGATKEVTIREFVEKSTQRAGAELNTDIGRSAQPSTAKKVVDMVNDLYASEPHSTLACVRSGFNETDDQPVAYGRPVKIGNGKIELDAFPAELSAETAKKITASRKAIATEQNVYDQNSKDEQTLLELLKGRLEISRPNGSALFRIEHGEEYAPLPKQTVDEVVIPALQRLLGVEVKHQAHDEDTKGRAYNLACELTPQAKGALQALANEFKIPIQEEKKANLAA